MIVKKSTIVLLSAIFVLNLYFIFQIGVRHGQHKAIIPIRRGLDIARAVQKPDRSKGMQNGESVLERQETLSLEFLVNAIFKAEGSYRAKYLYGIQSVKYSSEAKARQACEETIINNYSRWIAKGCLGEYLEFLSKVYCPYNSKVWLKNVIFFLTKDK